MAGKTAAAQPARTGPLRALGAVRLSVQKDESTSPQRQTEAITGEAQHRGMTLVAIAEDLNVSASKVGPFDRPELGDWLNNRSDEFDAIIWWRMDRAARSMTDLAKLAGWAKENGKRLIFASGPGGGAMELDMTSPVAELIALILAFAAQMESQAISERVTGSHSYLRRNGRWGGGMFPYGLMPIENPDGEGWILVHDPETAPIVKELIRRVIAGESQNAVCQDFNSREIPTPRDYLDQKNGRSRDIPRKWSQSATSKILRSRSLLGESIHEGKPVIDSDGNVVQRTEPLITAADWKLLQDALDQRSITRERSQSTSPLLNVAVCYECKHPLYIRRYTAKGKLYSYYICRNAQRGTANGYSQKCPNKFIHSATLDQIVTDTVMFTIGGLEVMERVLIPGSDHTAKLDAVTNRLAELRRHWEIGLYEGEEAEYERVALRLKAQQRELEQLPNEPDRWELRGTGKTYAEVWESLSDDDGRRAFLLRSGIKLWVHAETVKQPRPNDGAMVDTGDRVTIDIPANLVERLRSRVPQTAKKSGMVLHPAP